jgi:hypothetical protein
MIQNPHRDFPLVTKQLLGENRFIGWIESVTELLNKLDIQDGLVTPNGAVFAPQKRYYFDTVLGELWFKTTAETSNTGWVQIV